MYSLNRFNLSSFVISKSGCSIFQPTHDTQHKNVCVFCVNMQANNTVPLPPVPQYKLIHYIR